MTCVITGLVSDYHYYYDHRASFYFHIPNLGTALATIIAQNTNTLYIRDVHHSYVPEGKENQTH